MNTQLSRIDHIIFKYVLLKILIVDGNYFLVIYCERNGLNHILLQRRFAQQPELN